MASKSSARRFDDKYTAVGAESLKKAINAYWHDRGATHVRAERYALPGMVGVWGVRSNLVNGLPPALVSV